MGGHMRALLLSICTALLLSTSPLFSQAPPQAPPKESRPAKAAQPGAATASLGDFDAYVAQAMKDWKVPGVAIAVVKDGKVILSKGYGLRDVKNNLPITTKTMFPI